jgi:transcriptional regulator with XRE-family HTH domain
VAIGVVSYRAQHGLSQRQLAERLGMKQPAIARIEAGEHNPSIETLIHLSRVLGMEFLLHISPVGQRERWVTPAGENAGTAQTIVSTDHRVLVVAR